MLFLHVLGLHYKLICSQTWKLEWCLCINKFLVNISSFCLSPCECAQKNILLNIWRYVSVWGAMVNGYMRQLFCSDAQMLEHCVCYFTNKWRPCQFRRHLWLPWSIYAIQWFHFFCWYDYTIALLHFST